jgi:hypothetical protein
LSHLDLESLVGPNGRRMPGPDTTIDEIIESKRLHRAITEFSRAFGSTLDCLSAAVIGVLGLPTSLQRAAGVTLLTLPPLGELAPAEQRVARDAMEAVFRAHTQEPPAGWVAWALELRDAVVHRGHLTQD